MELPKISSAEICDAYCSSVRIDFENGESMFLYGDTNLTYFMVQSFSYNKNNYSDCKDEKISKLIDYITKDINDDHNETHALFRGLIKIYLDFSLIKGKDKN